MQPVVECGGQVPLPDPHRLAAFDEPDHRKICLHHRETQPLAPSFLNPSLPHPVERVFLRALEKDPRRYQTVGDLLRALQKALDAPACIGQLSCDGEQHT